MKFGNVGVAVIATTVLATTAFAAPPPMISLDKSGSFLIDAASTEKIWNDNTSARVKKLYPARRFRFVSEVGGGFNDAKMCVITARAMVLPLQGKALVYAPIRAATTFDAVPDMNREQCKDLARKKLTEAVQSVEDSFGR